MNSRALMICAAVWAITGIAQAFAAPGYKPAEIVRLFLPA